MKPQRPYNGGVCSWRDGCQVTSLVEAALKVRCFDPFAIGDVP